MLFKSSTKQLNYLNQGQNRAFIRGSLYVLIALLCGVSLTTGQAPFHASADFIGLDSNLYMHVSKYFTSEIFNQSYNGYQIQRIFPFALINVLFQAFHVPMTDANFLLSQTICNALALIIGIYLLFKISDHLKWSLTIEIIAFSCLFLNFHTLKIAVCMPFNTDHYALLLSLIMLYAYLRDRGWLILLSGIVGAFSWPTLLITSLLLYLFAKQPFVIQSRTCLSRLSQRAMSLLRVGGALIVLPVLMLTFYMYASPKTWDGLGSIYQGSWFDYNYINQVVTLCAILCEMIFVYRMLLPFRFEIGDLWQSIRKTITPYRCFWAAFVLFAVKIIQYLLTNNESFWDAAGMIKHTALRATSLPFVFLEAHFVFYGLLVVLLLFHWRKALTSYSQYGLGYLGVIAMMMILAVNSESRYMIYLLPFAVVPFLDSIKTIPIKRWVPWAILICQLLLSHFWLPLSSDWLLKIFYLEIQRPEFNGLYNGAFQHVEMYIVGSILLLIAMGIYYWGKKKSWFINLVEK